MSPWKILTKHLFIMLLALSASGTVSAKVASGPQNLSGIVHQGESVVNALMHQGKTESSDDGMSDSSVVTKGIAPSEINFSQRTVSGNVEKYVRDMKVGNWDWNKSGPIRIMQQDGKWVSYDNRRLMAAQQAGLKDIPYEVVDPKEIMPGSKKTWEQAFRKRFNDRRNVDAGGSVPSGGLSTQPSVPQ